MNRADTRSRDYGEASAAKVRAAEGSIPDSQWRKLHPISPVVNAWKALVLLVTIVAVQNAQYLIRFLDSDFSHSLGITTLVLLVAGSVLGFLLIVAVFSWLSWRATSFAVTDVGVYYRSGILKRTLKQARLERIQAVDIVHPLLGRIAGLGRLNIEVAGGPRSNLSLGYLKTAHLETLRAEILARAAGVYVDPAASMPALGTASADGLRTAAAVSVVEPRAAEAPERVLYTLSVGRLLGSIVTSLGMIIGLFIVLAAVISGVVFIIMRGIGGLVILLPLSAAPLAFVSFIWARFAGEFSFTAAVSPDGIRTRSGLTDTRSQTILPRRVHAVRIHQSWLWRAFGWYRVTITQAGYVGQEGADANSSQSAQVLLPVGSREDAELALWLVVRDLGVAEPQDFLTAALHGRGDGFGFVPISERARTLLDCLVRDRRAVALTDTCVVIRDGWLNRDASFIPVERLQSIGVTQGPLERLLDLVNVHAQIVRGTTPSTARHLDAVQGARLVEELRIKSRVKRAAEPPERWMQRVEARLGAQSAVEAVLRAMGAQPVGEGQPGL